MSRCFSMIVAGLLLAGCASTPQKQEAKDGFVSLFDGKSLEGWKPNENGTTFSVKDEMIVVHGTRCHMFYVGPVGNHDFRNFHLKAQVKTEPNSNSGIYFHTA